MALMLAMTVAVIERGQKVKVKIRQKRGIHQKEREKETQRERERDVVNWKVKEET